MSVNKSQNELTPRQRKGIVALLNEPSTKAAAAAAGVAEATIHRWLNDLAFSAALKEARARVFESTLSSLQSASGKAVQVLRDVMDDDKAHPSTRVRAALGIIGAMLKAHEALETEERLRSLEILYEQLTAKFGAE
jgi:hypothetical protein